MNIKYTESEPGICIVARSVAAVIGIAMIGDVHYSFAR